MSADGRFARDVTERQVAMFAAFVGPKLYITRAALKAASGIPESTLKSWANGAAMPLHGVLALAHHLPAEAINMMFEPADKRLVDVEAEETNWDEIAADAAGLVSEICEARRDGKIDHVEDAKLRNRGRRLLNELSDAVADG